MADATIIVTPFAGKKRSRDEDDLDGIEHDARVEKKARPGSGDSNISDPWAQARDSVLNTPKSMTNADYSRGKFPTSHYDSDDQDSMISEPGSLQDIAMSTDDEEMSNLDNNDAIKFSQSPSEPFSSKLSSSPWQTRTPNQQNRVPTPIIPPGTRSPIHIRTGHLRHRHPQENIASSAATDALLEVPSPIDEDEVPTPPSAAEAAGSQLSMLTVNDMDFEPSSSLPTISVDISQTLPFRREVANGFEIDSAIADGFDVDAMDSSAGLGLGEAGLVVRKQRARSGALSEGGGSPGPVRAEPLGKRGFSMGFRAECEKCRMRVPGHMNHFIN